MLFGKVEMLWAMGFPASAGRRLLALAGDHIMQSSLGCHEHRGFRVTKGAVSGGRIGVTSMVLGAQRRRRGW